ncbi:hypothetical protein JCM11641_003718 [Rhodosporidiobolus odoratus]
MASLLNLPGAKGKAENQGYAPLDAPVKSHTVSAGGIKDKDIELGDLGADVFFDEVSSIREAIREFDSTSLETLRTKQLTSLQGPNDDLSVELNELAAALALQSNEFKTRIAKLGEQVGKDEARRSHWENLKAQLGRAVEKWQRIEMGQREKVKERVARQMQIVNPAVTEDEIRAVVDTSASSPAPQIFAQAVAGSRSTAAMSALNEAQNRRSELVAIESTLVELAAMMQQVAELVLTQDSQFIHIEETAKGVETDMEQGMQQVSKARLSAAAARHKRKLCAAFGAVLLIVVIVVISTQLSGVGGGGKKSEENKTETVSGATDTATKADTATATATAATTDAAATAAPAVRW